VKAAAATVGIMMFGWALVTAADARHEAKPPQTAYQVLTVAAEAVYDEPDETPYADSLVDWVEVDRQTDCLWTFLQEHEIELTLANVITAGDWTDMHGGACAMIGEDDE
jgi:hypothetical protein